MCALSAAGSKAYTVPYTVTVKGAGPYTSVSPWEWSASVDASGLVLPFVYSMLHEFNIALLIT